MNPHSEGNRDSPGEKRFPLDKLTPPTCLKSSVGETVMPLVNGSALE